MECEYRRNRSRKWTLTEEQIRVGRQRAQGKDAVREHRLHFAACCGDEEARIAMDEVIVRVVSAGTITTTQYFDARVIYAHGTVKSGTVSV